ncbi:MAG TPA: hypothetical protein V6C58_15165 [Allocoleopsis sp.]
MIYLLDTNTCIVYLKGLNLKLKQKLESHKPSEIAVLHNQGYMRQIQPP